MKKLTFTLLFILLILSTQPLTLQAATSTIPTATPDLTALKQKGDTMITLRIGEINALTKHIQTLQLDPSEKITLTSSLSDTKSSLTQLKSRIDNDTTKTQLSSDIQSIVSHYKIFAFYEPQLHMSLALKILQSQIQQLSLLYTNLHTSIYYYNTQGIDSTSLEQKIDDIEVQLRQTNALLNNDHQKVIALYTSPETVSSMNSQLENDLKKIEDYLGSITNDLTDIQQTLSSVSVTSTPSQKPTLSCTPRPACLDKTPKCLIAEPSTGWCPLTTRQ